MAIARPKKHGRWQRDESVEAGRARFRADVSRRTGIGTDVIHRVALVIFSDPRFRLGRWLRLDLTEEDRTVLSQVTGAPGDVVQRVVEGIGEFLDENMPLEKKLVQQ